MKDFFSRYRESEKHAYFVPAIFGVLFAFTFVANYNGVKIDFGNIKANVIEANTPKVNYGADLLMERSGSNLVFRIGKDAENIETLNFSLLGDPSILQGLQSTTPETTIIGNEPGIFLVKIGLSRSIQAGEILAVLTPELNGKTALAVIDAGFTSSGGIYSLSTKGE